MIGTLPMIELAPLEYRYALDAATTLLTGDAPLLCCNVPALEAEARQRFPAASTAGFATAALWVEPLHTTWRADLRRMTRALNNGGTLAIVASQPLARLLPECRAWNVPALGRRLHGIGKLRRALPRLGYTIGAVYGVHSVQSIALNLIGQQYERRGRPDLSDRLHFAARWRYRTSARWAALATVALIVARKGRGSC